MSRRRIILVALVLAVAVTCVVYWSSQREPSYQGKRLSVWLEEAYHEGLGSTDAPARADEAVRAIGKRAIPRLLKMVEAKDSRVKLLFMRVAAAQSFMHIDYTPDYYFNERGAAGFRALGREAKDALPELVRLLHDMNTTYAAASAMSKIGPESVAILREGLTNQHEWTRDASARALADAGSNAWVAVPDLVACLKDKTSVVSYSAAASLGSIGQRPDLVIPALMEDLDGRGLRISAAEALGKFGRQATIAVPALLKAMSATNIDKRFKRDFQQTITNALWAIDPSVDPVAATINQRK